jgi:glycosyltransferase involved in cell wall biosynthesis
MTISVIATVLNERGSVRRLLESLAAQTLLPDEIVIVDGGSTDGTLDVLRAWPGRLPLRVISAPGANISAGRNRAIAEASGELIAATDAGVVLSPGWLEAVTAPLRENPALTVCGGFFQADAHTVFEAALGASTLPRVDEVRPAAFLPSSRSIAFRKAAWQAVGGYPEWLDYCEDLIFDLRLKASGPPFAFAPRAVVYFRPRSTLRRFFTQYYRYARGDGKADLWRKRHAIRYATYLLAGPLGLLLMLRVHPGFALLLVLGGLLYLRRPYQRLRQVLSDAARTNGVRVTLASNLAAVAWIPVIRLTGDIAKMLGYPVGWLWRLRQRPPDWRQS